MNSETLLRSLTSEDLKAILRGQNEDSSGTDEELRGRVQRRSEGLSWKFLLISVPKESLQRICAADGLRSDLSKDELIDQIVRSFPKKPKPGPLRGLFSPWQRWGAGNRGRR